MKVKNNVLFVWIKSNILKEEFHVSINFVLIAFLIE